MDGMFGGGGLTPEQIQAFMEYGANQGAFTEQDRAIQQALAQAQALRTRRPETHSTGIGGGLSAAGDILSAYAGRRDQAAAQERDTALQKERIKALRKLAGLPEEDVQQPRGILPGGGYQGIP